MQMVESLSGIRATQLYTYTHSVITNVRKIILANFLLIFAPISRWVQKWCWWPRNWWQPTALSFVHWNDFLILKTTFTKNLHLFVWILHSESEKPEMWKGLKAFGPPPTKCVCHSKNQKPNIMSTISIKSTVCKMCKNTKGIIIAKEDFSFHFILLRSLFSLL